jgi:hypothetical protein
MSASDFSPGHRALPRIFANPKESQLAEITQLLFQSGSKISASARVVVASAKSQMPHSIVPPSLIAAIGEPHCGQLLIVKIGLGKDFRLQNIGIG